MPFNLKDQSRTEPQWIQYASGGVSARFLLKPPDPAFLRKLSWKYTPQMAPDLSLEQRAKDWVRDYLLHFLLDWDVVLGEEKAPITGETVMLLPDAMQYSILEATGSHLLAEYTLEGPELAPPVESEAISGTGTGAGQPASLQGEGQVSTTEESGR